MNRVLGQGPSPLVVAHRAGNDLASLRRAQDLGIPLIELDVHLRGGRLEVRHLKTLGPLPVLWDRWRLAPGWGPRLTLDELLGATKAGTELMLDLKGSDPRLGIRAARTLATRSAMDPVTVCARAWSLLDRVEDVPGTRIVHSVGSRRQLAALRRRFAGRRLRGVSIHRKLLDPETVADLRERSELILTWPIVTPDEARLMAAWGVDGVISEHFERLAAALQDEVPA